MNVLMRVLSRWVETHVGMDDPDPEPATPPKVEVR